MLSYNLLKSLITLNFFLKTYNELKLAREPAAK
jgi:hypothetical protein